MLGLVPPRPTLSPSTASSPLARASTSVYAPAIRRGAAEHMTHPEVAAETLQAPASTKTLPSAASAFGCCMNRTVVTAARLVPVMLMAVPAPPAVGATPVTAGVLAEEYLSSGQAAGVGAAEGLGRTPAAEPLLTRRMAFACMCTPACDGITACMHTHR